MSEYTPITGELREYATVAWNPWPEAKDRLYQMCDAIDSIHAQLERENESLKSELDRVLGEDERDGWIELPKDADGVPIRFKDKVTVPWSDKVYEVGGFSYQENVHTGTMTIWINTHVDGEYRALCATDSCHHHVPDTWERIIEDVRRRTSDYYCNNIPCNFREMAEEMVARCKALCECTKEAGE